MRLLRLLGASAARVALAVVIVLLARGAFRQPYQFTDIVAAGTPVPVSAPAAVLQGARPVPTLRAMRVIAPFEQVWNQMYVVYGDRLAQAALRANAADYLATWQEMGSFLRAHDVTTAMFQERMTQLGWPGDEQERLLVAAGYVWPPRQPGDDPPR